MSQNGLLPAGIEVQDIRDGRYNNSCALAGITLLCYDLTITFPDEVRCIWQRKFTGATVLFCINRYGTLLLQIFQVLSVLQTWQNQTEESADLVGLCNVIGRFFDALTVITQITVALLVALRVYAIWQKNRWIFVVVFALGLTSPVMNIYYFTILNIISAPSPLTGCGAFLNDLTVTNLELSASIINSVYDAVVLALTWAKTAGIRKSSSQLGIKTSLATLLLRDGTIYFLLLLILNIVNLVLSELVQDNPFSYMRIPVTSVLISRFILNLRGVYTPGGNATDSLHLSKFSDIRFASSVVGNLGAPLGFEEEEDRSLASRPKGEDIYTVNISDDPLMEYFPSEPASSDDALGTTLEEEDVHS